MTRIANSGNATELAKETIIACMCVDLNFASGHVYANDGFCDITFGGHTYSPLGQFAGIELVEEGVEIIARPVRLTLSGVDSALLTPAIGEVYQNRSISLYMALIDKTTGQLVATPETLWEGRMDYMEIELGAKTGTITLNCEHRLRTGPRIARYTDADQQQLYPGDKFFEFLQLMVGMRTQWGKWDAGWSGPGTGGQGQFAGITSGK